jgi:capsular polysaccharide transport system permease protein
MSVAARPDAPRSETPDADRPPAAPAAKAAQPPAAQPAQAAQGAQAAPAARAAPPGPAANAAQTGAKPVEASPAQAAKPAAETGPGLHAVRPAPPAGAKPAPAPARPGGVVALPGPAEPRVAKPATTKPRHRLALTSFVLAVVLPTVGAAGYLWGVAADQYASRTAFSVRGAEAQPSLEFLGAMAPAMGGASADAEIVYEYVRSQRMVEDAAARLPLTEMFNRAADDPVFRLGEGRPIEDLVAYWNWMTDIAYEPISGIVHFEARAFAAEDARAIAQTVLDLSTEVVNALSTRAREDAISVARASVAEAEERLRAVRRDLRAFRDVEQELDPAENARAALGLVAELEADLARARVELDTQVALLGPTSPRVAALRQTIVSLRDRIAAERARIGEGAAGAADGQGRRFADLVAEYEELVVDREFAENVYVAALSSYESAQIDARRQMRFLAPHIHPTLSEEAQHPRRLLLTAGVFLTLCALWATLLLIVYNIRDRR